MKKSLLFLFLILSVSVMYSNPVQYDKDSGIPAAEFFEKEYRQIWNSLSEVEQFAIAATSNVFERNKQYHLDFTNKTVFDKKTRPGKEVLTQNWKIYGYTSLMENFNELTEGEQAATYRKLEAMLEKYPDNSVIEIGIKEELTVTEVSRMYMVQQMKPLLGIHGIDAWVQVRSISILRWAISAGYINQDEAMELITPIVAKIKDNYQSFDDFIAHWIAGYCFNEVFSSNTPECGPDLLDAIDSARAYIPFEELPFTGKNADKNHKMTAEQGVYTPSELAAKMIPLQRVYKRYWNDDPSEAILRDLIKEEQAYPEISDLTVLCHIVLMCSFSTVEERIDYIDSKNDFLKTRSEDSQWGMYLRRVYFNDLLRTYQPEKLITLYKALPQKLQINEDLYFDYGYANYLMTNLCGTVLERDVYISRAKDVFKRLISMDYDIGDYMYSWLNALESL